MNPSSLIKVATFYLLVVGMAFVQLAVLFGGLTHSEGMERAQIARELARGNGYTTKCLRPALLAKRNEGREVASFDSMKDTMHAPAGPWVTSLALGFSEESDFKLNRGNLIGYDRVVATTQGAFLLLSIGLAYLLATQLFDRKIGFVVALLMVFNLPLWKLAKTGLPHCMLLFFFLLILILFHKMTRRSEDGAPLGLLPLLTGVAFGVLILTKWLTLWLLFGALIYSVFALKPRIRATLMLLAGSVGVTCLWLVRNAVVTGSPFGPWKHFLSSGIGGTGNFAFQVYRADVSLPLSALFSRLVALFQEQTYGLFGMLGGTVIAPFFFFALFHLFRRSDLGKMRWLVLLMWIFGVLGMSLYGLQTDFINQDTAYSANQLHILFLPVMAAYGLALLTILWNRLNLQPTVPFSKTGHLAIVAILGVLPVLLSLPLEIRKSIFGGEEVFAPEGYAPNLHRLVGQTEVDPEGILFSDAPWATSWYGDRISVMLPYTEETNRIAFHAKQSGRPVQGLLLSPRTTRRHLDRRGGPISGARGLHPLYPPPLGEEGVASDRTPGWGIEIYRTVLDYYPPKAGASMNKIFDANYEILWPDFRKEVIRLPEATYGVVEHTFSGTEEFVDELNKTFDREYPNER